MLLFPLRLIIVLIWCFSVVTTGRKPYPHEISAAKYASTELEADTEVGTEQERPYISSIADRHVDVLERFDFDTFVDTGDEYQHFLASEDPGAELVNDYFVATATGKPNEVSLFVDGIWRNTELESQFPTRPPPRNAF